MIEFTKEERDELRTLITNRVGNYGFVGLTGSALVPETLSVEKQNIRFLMFLSIGINSTGRCNSFISIRDFIRRGVNRFFLSLHNRYDLSEKALKENKYSGKYLIVADFYIGPTAFGTALVPDKAIREWNTMMRPIRVCKKHGVKVVMVKSEKDSSAVKYRWIDKTCKN